jgi:hypothetical protein
MNLSHDIEIIKENPNYIRFILWSSPEINNINFIKNKNKTTKRKYASAEIKLGDSIEPQIIRYFNENGIDKSKIAFISYIEIIKILYNKTKRNTLKTFTELTKRNINKTNKSKKYYNSRNNKYILSKGYGKILLNHVEQYLKENGIEYLALVPSVKSLVKYYNSLGYKEYIMPNIEINEEYNRNARKYSEYVSPNVLMYKEL